MLRYVTGVPGKPLSPLNPRRPAGPLFPGSPAGPGSPCRPENTERWISVSTTLSLIRSHPSLFIGIETCWELYSYWINRNIWSVMRKVTYNYSRWMFLVCYVMMMMISILISNLGSLFACDSWQTLLSRGSWGTRMSPVTGGASLPSFSLE